jgi:hypothetical protein
LVLARERWTLSARDDRTRVLRDALKLRSVAAGCGLAAKLANGGDRGARIGVSVREARVIHASAHAALIGQCLPQPLATRNKSACIAVC